MTWAYFTLDHLGSVAVIANQSGNVVQRLSYDAWGKQRTADGTDATCGAVTTPTTRGFTNQEQMPAGCIVNLNARLYDPSIGKFMAADSIVGNPFNGQSFNRYAYVMNNPLSGTDPTGHLCDSATCAFGPEFNGLPGLARPGGSGDFTDQNCCYSNSIIPVNGTLNNNELNLLPPYYSASPAGFSSNNSAAFRGNLNQGNQDSSGPRGVGHSTTTDAAGNQVEGVFGYDLSAAANSVPVWGDPSSRYGKNGVPHEQGLGNGGEDILFGLLTLPFGGEGFGESAAVRGLSRLGGIFSKETNAVGGEVWTSVGDVSQNDFAGIVNGGMFKGDVNILTGVHGTPGGDMITDLSLYNADVNAFGNLPGVAIHNLPEMNPDQINSLLNGEGTTIGGFCNSAVCLAPFK